MIFSFLFLIQNPNMGSEYEVSSKKISEKCKGGKLMFGIQASFEMLNLTIL